MSNVLHLVRRAVSSLRNVPPGPTGEATAGSILNDGELALWTAMDPRDRNHSLVVLARFDALAPSAPAEVRAAVLLHDVGKNVSRLSWVMRVVATLVGPRGRRFSDYHDHEELGSDLLEGVSTDLTRELVAGRGPSAFRSALDRADDV